MSNKLSDLHPKVAELARLLVVRSSAKGVPIAIASTLRTFDEQTALYAIGRTIPPIGKIVTKAKAGWSYHNYGLAFDIAVIRDGTVDYTQKADVNKNNVWDYLDVGQIGQDVGLEWGGSWQSFKDYPHFQYTFGLSISDLLSGTRPPTT